MYGRNGNCVIDTVYFCFLSIACILLNHVAFEDILDFIALQGINQPVFELFKNTIFQ